MGYDDEKPSCKEYVAFGFILILNLADVGADWVFFATLVSFENGLVYGPEPPSILWSVLGFAIAGSVLFTFETTNSGLRLFCSSTCIRNEDLVSAIAVWFADVPMIILNVIVAACREELVNHVQYAKAGIILAGAVIRFLVVVLCFCGDKKHLKSKVVLSIGLLLTAVGSVMIFVFSLYDMNLQPHDSSKYFDNVGIFVRQDVVFREKGVENLGWVEVVNIQTVRQSQNDLFFAIGLGTLTPGTLLFYKYTNNASDPLLENCTSLDVNDGLKSSTEPLATCVTAVNTITDAISTLIKFRFIKPDHGIVLSPRVFGDISFSIKQLGVLASGQVLSGSKEITNSSDNLVRYFGYPSGSATVDTAPVYPTSALRDIGDVWKTGYFNCDLTASKGPTEDNQIPIELG